MLHPRLATRRLATRQLATRQLATAVALLLGVAAAAHAQGAAEQAPPRRDRGREAEPLLIERQGSFYYGGRVLETPGTHDDANIFDNRGELFVEDAGYAFFQIPPNARRLPIVMWHGGGQTGKTFEDFEDRENFQSIFLRRGWSVYIIDQPRVGRAGLPTFTGRFGELLGEQRYADRTSRYGLHNSVEAFRLGTYTEAGGTEFFPGVQFPQTRAALLQLAAQTVPIIPTGRDTNVAAQVELFEKIGPAILLTHSASGGPGWYTAMGTQSVRAVVSYEPAGGFPFPEGEAPAGSPTVTLAEFERLTRIPIQMIFGDYIPSAPSASPRLEVWRQTLATARLFAAAVNRHGGDAEVVHLPEVGLHGNTHFPFADLNNREVAALLTRYLREKGLDARARRGR
jgi:hypothetical protein